MSVILISQFIYGEGANAAAKKEAAKVKISAPQPSKSAKGKTPVKAKDTPEPVRDSSVSGSRPVPLNPSSKITPSVPPLTGSFLSTYPDKVVDLNGAQLVQVKVNPVVAAIERQLPMLRESVNNESPDTIVWEIEPGVPDDYVKSIKDQHLYFRGAFPELTSKSQFVYILFMTPDFMVEAANRNGCPSMPFLAEPIANIRGSRAGSSRCGGNFWRGVTYVNVPSYQKFEAPIPRSALNQGKWEYLAGQESHGGLVQDYYNYGISRSLASGSVSTKNRVAMPAWYEQGGQYALASIALATSTRQWRQSSLSNWRLYTGCAVTPLTANLFYEASCYDTVGGVATELMVALYGFDAMTKWQENMTPVDPGDRLAMTAMWERSFEEAYGDDMKTFTRLAEAYAEYLISQRASLELIQRMNAIGK
jgi:hypothetical protein